MDVIFTRPGGFDDTKANVTRIFRDNFGDTHLGDGFENCLARDKMYSKLLEETIDGNVSREEYEAFIYGDGYNLTLAQSLAWTSDIALFFHRAVEGTQVQPEGQRNPRERI